MYPREVWWWTWSDQGVLCRVGRVCRRAGMAGAGRLEAIKAMASLRIKQYGRQGRHGLADSPITGRRGWQLLSGMEHGAWSMGDRWSPTHALDGLHGRCCAWLAMVPVCHLHLRPARLQSLNPVPCTRPDALCLCPSETSALGSFIHSSPPCSLPAPASWPPIHTSSLAALWLACLPACLHAPDPAATTPHTHHHY